jgi:hypothetical protein
MIVPPFKLVIKNGVWRRIVNPETQKILLPKLQTHVSSQTLVVATTHRVDVSVRPSVKSPESWAFGRVFAFVQKTANVFYKADRDIAVKYGLLKE